VSKTSNFFAKDQRWLLHNYCSHAQRNFVVCGKSTIYLHLICICRDINSGRVFLWWSRLGHWHSTHSNRTVINVIVWHIMYGIQFIRIVQFRNWEKHRYFYWVNLISVQGDKKLFVQQSSLDVMWSWKMILNKSADQRTWKLPESTQMSSPPMKVEVIFSPILAKKLSSPQLPARYVFSLSAFFTTRSLVDKYYLVDFSSIRISFVFVCFWQTFRTSLKVREINMHRIDAW